MGQNLWIVAVVGGFISAAVLAFCAFVVVRGQGRELWHNPLALLMSGFLASRGAVMIYGNFRLLHSTPELRPVTNLEAVLIGWVPALFAIAWMGCWVRNAATGREMGSYFFMDRRQEARRVTKLQDGVLQKVVVGAQMCRLTDQPCSKQTVVQAVLNDGVQDLQTNIAEIVTETGLAIAKVQPEPPNRRKRERRRLVG